MESAYESSAKSRKLQKAYRKYGWRKKIMTDIKKKTVQLFQRIPEDVTLIKNTWTYNISFSERKTRGNFSKTSV